ncbi:AAA family ATPase [Mycobacterium sp. 852013-51886_SCH5428379]|uniref:bifunctional aminoglycoside phosphotransferase/ATP-binding protein n=1 Tax=Mycobacterium sp. 852013-51886_SCH5428379 TaxID=1834111 RepID=UPI000AF18075|nr:AAA family ATPase [Mycobacterium sp. 852013-51886_SCH5428379]
MTTVWNTAAEVHETHTGVVFMFGDRAYKVKKPVVTDFLDFSSLDSRERVCAREVELNSRLAPGGYLGVGHVHSPGQEGPEPVVVMRRYPDTCRLRSMILRGEPVTDQLTALAGMLATFHSESHRSAEIDACATVSAVEDRWYENLDELDRSTGTVLPQQLVGEVRRLVTRYLDGRAALFAGRIAASRIVDGHGDLSTDDVFCAPEGPVPLDCLEFDDQLRFVDGIDDAAFLAMDLEFLGRQDLAEVFLDRYRELAGDTVPRSLIDFYIAYRAVVRAKVDCIRVGQGHDASAADARWHLKLAVNHLRAATVRLVIVGGGPGTGKTTLATALGESLPAQVLSTDVVRRELQADGVIDGDVGALNAGLYAPQTVELVYKTMLRRAASLLANGVSVILDGTWREASHRAAARAAAERNAAAFVELSCTTSLAAAQKRIEDRGETASDATPQIAAEITAPTWPEAHRVDTGRPLADSVADAQQICCLAV